jgi:predicted Zn finger-like uncharacterized protein
MILTCPNCGTQYAVKDGAIPEHGRQVRCAACKHSWHQDPEVQAGVEPVAVPEPEPHPAPEQEGVAAPEPEPTAADEADRDDGDESLAEATLIEPRSGVAAEERAFEEAILSGETSSELGETAAPAPPAGDFMPSEQGNLAGVGAVGAAPAAADWGEPPVAEAQDDDFSPFADREDEFEPERR